jgi:hypothetical protein
MSGFQVVTYSEHLKSGSLNTRNFRKPEFFEFGFQMVGPFEFWSSFQTTVQMTILVATLF